jgi:predicted TIM-barrel fold metal-dependent hydrolase
MLYDVHTHIGIDPGFYYRGWWPYASTVQDLLNVMQAHGIDRAVSFPFCVAEAYDYEAFAYQRQVKLRPGRVPYERENAMLVQEIERIDLERRLLPLAMFDPNREVPAQVAALRKLAPRLTGLKLQGTVIQSPVRGLLDVGKPLMELAAEFDLPVLIHTSIGDTDTWSQTRDCMGVAAANPKVRFNLAHSMRFHEASLRESRNLPNVWIDCSAHLAHCLGVQREFGYIAKPDQRVKADYHNPVDVLLKIYDIIGDRYLWGSDNPFMSWCDDTIRAVFTYQQEADVLHALPAKVKQSMGSDAPRAWLGGKAR